MGRCLNSRRSVACDLGLWRCWSGELHRQRVFLPALRQLGTGDRSAPRGGRGRLLLYWRHVP
jgi:hypothetical protein